MTSQDVQCGSRDQVAVSTQWHLIGTLAFIGDLAVEGSFGFGVGID